MHAFLAERSPPIEGPVAAKVRRDFCAFVARRADKAERHHDVEANLVERSRRAIAQSFALLAKVPDLTENARYAPNLDWAPGDRDAVLDEAPRWRAFLGDEGGDRYFFDIDDGELMRRDDVGMVLSSRDAISRETRAILFDLAYAVIPGGRPRLFSAQVRNRRGAVIYKGSMTMRPMTADRS